MQIIASYSKVPSNYILDAGVAELSEHERVSESVTPISEALEYPGTFLLLLLLRLDHFLKPFSTSSTTSDG